MASLPRKQLSALEGLSTGQFWTTVMGKTLRSWKEIAAYTGVSIRTVQRWEREFGLPVRRVATKRGSVVFAFRSELDAWLRTRPKGAEALMHDEHFRVLFFNSPLPTLVLDNARRILDVNAALCEMWGFPRSQFVGRSADAFSQDRIEYDEEEWSKFLLAGASIGQRNIRHSTGSMLGIQYAVKSISPGLNMVAVVATRPGGLPGGEVHYRLGTTSFMF